LLCMCASPRPGYLPMSTHRRLLHGLRRSLLISIRCQVPPEGMLSTLCVAQLSSSMTWLHEKCL
jgi:hypothetical protein